MLCPPAIPNGLTSQGRANPNPLRILLKFWPKALQIRQPLASFPNETITEGLDGLRERFVEYYKLGATRLLIRGYDPRPDAVQYGEELIPRLRELVADYDAKIGDTDDPI